VNVQAEGTLSPPSSITRTGEVLEVVCGLGESVPSGYEEGVDAGNSDGSVTVEDGASSRRVCRWVVVRWDDLGLSLHPYGVYGELGVVKIEDGSGDSLLESEESSTLPSAETSINLSAVAETDKIKVDAILMSEKLEKSESKDPLTVVRESSTPMVPQSAEKVSEKDTGTVDRGTLSRQVSYRPDGSVEGVRIKIAAFESGAVKKGKEDVSRSVSKESAGPSSFVRSVVKELESKKLFARSVRSREEGDESLRRQRSTFQHQQHLTRSGLTGRKGRRELGLEAVLEDEPAESFASVKADLRRPLPLLGSAATSRLNSSVQSTNRVGLSGTGRDRTILFRGSLDDTCLCVPTTAATGRIEGPPGESLRGSDSIPLVERESRGGRSSVGMAATGSAKRPKSIGYGRTGLSALSTSIELGKSDNNQKYRDKIFGGHEMRGDESGGQSMAVGRVVIRGTRCVDYCIFRRYRMC